MLQNDVFSPAIHNSEEAEINTGRLRKGKIIRFFLGCLIIAMMSSGCSRATLTLVQDGQARAVVVTADQPSEVAAYAAAELVEHVRRATGAELAIVPESAAPTAAETRRIFVGPTRAAAEQGIEAAGLPADASRLKVVDGDLYIVGLETGGDPLGHRTRRGTLYGVYEILERYLGVVWLWPGELGTYVPKSTGLKVDSKLDEIREPALRFRNFRYHGVRREMSPNIARLAFTPEGREAYLNALEQYLVRHHHGYTDPKPTVGHYFEGWWERYGDEHPDWFMMRENGERGPEPGGSTRHVAMCVSNPDLHRYIVEEAWDGSDILRLGEVDRAVFCKCPDCREWDLPLPAAPPAFAASIYDPMVTNRYARFWSTVRALAAERNPEVMVTTFLYWNYQMAPLVELDLRGVYGEYVPWGQNSVTYYPMSDEAHQWNKDQWQGWHELGVTMAYRPNYLLGGYVMPHLSTWQAGDMMRFAYQHGMIGFDFDSLWAQWATKGPMLYMHMRLGAKPELTVARIREEFFSAFGPAADKVEDTVIP